ncbi:MAG: hypothetical protein KA885_01235 [Spirochaetes bacterium]|nr:hypothetical protein [Spirochaetota bacterium]
MSQFQKNLEENNQKETPMTYAIGILILCCSIVPILYGISIKDFKSIIVGGALILFSVLIMFLRYIIDKVKK